MNVLVIGAGEMGGALALALARHHDVAVVGASPASASAADVVRASNGSVRAGDIAAAPHADLVFLAVPWAALADVLDRLRPYPPRRLVSVVVPWTGNNAEPAVAHTDSAAEIIARSLPRTPVAGAFTTVGAATVREIGRYAEAPTVFLVGDDEETKRQAAAAATSIGFDAIDAGPLYAARFTETMGFLWTAMAFEAGAGEFVAFRAIRPR